MFGETLLESAPTVRRRKRWPIATAFTLELMVAGLFVLLPLLSTGVIPLKATVIVPTPPRYMPLENHQPARSSGNSRGISTPAPTVIPINTAISYRDRPAYNRSTDSSDPTPSLNITGSGSPNGIPDLATKGEAVVVRPPAKPTVISHTTDAMLLNKVVPEYPIIAKISGIQGEVKLHAFVDRNGNIKNLTVLGTPPPVLAKAALDAVEQWKYRPYFLNGEPVEIETFITVTFRKAN